MALLVDVEGWLAVNENKEDVENGLEDDEGALLGEYEVSFIPIAK
jgi:hypothetical protein